VLRDDDHTCMACGMAVDPEASSVRPSLSSDFPHHKLTIDNATTGGLIKVSMGLGFLSIACFGVVFYLGKTGNEGFSGPWFLELLLTFIAGGLSLVGLVLGLCSFDASRRKGIGWAIALNGIVAIPLAFFLLRSIYSTKISRTALKNAQ